MDFAEQNPRAGTLARPYDYFIDTLTAHFHKWAGHQCDEKSEFQTVGDGVLDVPAATTCRLRNFRRSRNISKWVVQEADPYI